MPRSKILKTNLQHFLLLGLIFSASFCCFAWAEEIKLKSGSTLTARIVDSNKDFIKVDLSGVTVTYYRDEIESIHADSLKSVEPKPVQEQFPSQRISNLIERVSQSVLIIEAKKATSTINGTGFFVSADGLIATNLHVVFNAASISVRTKTGENFPVEFIANYNDDLDICLLKINTANAPLLPLGDSDQLKPGEILFTIGHREGSFYQTSSGPFVGKTLIDEHENLQSKIVTGHGNSGGPILDQNGNLVGISKAFIPQSGHNFGIPINAAQEYFTYNQPLTVADFNRQISPANALTYNAEGLLLEGKYGEGLKNFKEALALDANYLKALVGIAKAYSAMRMNNEALSAWQDVYKRAPSNVSALTYLGKIYLDRNSLNEAISYLQKAADLAVQTPEIYRDLGFAYGQTGKLTQAIASYTKAIELNPQDADSHYNLSVAYFNKQNFTKAKEYSQKAKDLGYAIPESFLKQLSTAEKFGNTFEIK